MIRVVAILGEKWPLIYCSSDNLYEKKNDLSSQFMPVIQVQLIGQYNLRLN